MHIFPMLNVHHKLDNETTYKLCLRCFKTDSLQISLQISLELISSNYIYLLLQS